MYDAKTLLGKDTELLTTILAKTTLWANPKVYKLLVEHNNDRSGTWYPGVRRYNKSKGEKKGSINGIRLDDNTYANYGIKKALVGTDRSLLSGFAVCHIWPETCYDVRYHTNIANLVLAPQSISSLTDFDKNVQLALQFHSYQLYGWHPKNKRQPTKPEIYPSNWLKPLPFTPAVERALLHRRK